MDPKPLETVGKPSLTMHPNTLFGVFLVARRFTLFGISVLVVRTPFGLLGGLVSPTKFTCWTIGSDTPRLFLPKRNLLQREASVRHRFPTEQSITDNVEIERTRNSPMSESVLIGTKVELLISGLG